MSSSAANGYEKKDVKVSKIIAYTVVLVILFVTILIFLNEYFLYSSEEVYYENVLAPQSAQLQEVRAREHELLTQYKVIDAQKGIYQIPIERAMQLIADDNQKDTNKGKNK